MNTAKAIFNSKHRTGGTLENPTFVMDPYLRDVSGFSVDMVILPTTVYVVQSHNNTISFAEGGATYEATVATRNYTPTEFAAAVQTAMRAAHSGGGAPTYTCTYDAQAVKFKFGSDNSTSYTINANIGGRWRNNATINRLLGLHVDANFDCAALDQPVAAPNISELNLPEYLLLKSKNLGQLLCNTSTYVDGTQKSNTLCAVPVDEPFGHFVHYKPQYRYTFATPEKHLNLIDLQLANPDTNEQVNLNGYGFSVSFTFHIE